MFNCLDLDHLINSDIQIHSIRRILTVVWQCTLYSWFSKESNSHQINYIILCFRMSPFIFQWLWCMIHDSKENRCNTYVKCMYESFLQVCDRKQKQISKQHGTQFNNGTIHYNSNCFCKFHFVWYHLLVLYLPLIYVTKQILHFNYQN